MVVITRGRIDPAFLEHHRIAQACGIALMTLADCAVSGGVSTRESGRKIDVIYRRFDEDYFDTDLPELERVYLEGNVALVNAPGVGVADDKAVFPYVPAMIETYLGETPILRNAPTYALTEQETRAEVLDRLPEMVVKPREGYGGQGILVGPEAHSDAIHATRRNVNRDPTQFVAQETLDFSTHLLRGGNDASAEVFVDLRAFVLSAIDYLMPCGLRLSARRLVAPCRHAQASAFACQQRLTLRVRFQRLDGGTVHVCAVSVLRPRTANLPYHLRYSHAQAGIFGQKRFRIR